jgi:hypothetical protein
MSVGTPDDPLPGPQAKAPRCATCRHWEYTALYEASWADLPPDDPWFYGECALFNDIARANRPVIAYGQGCVDEPFIDTHWTFGCVLWEPTP